MSRKVYVEVKTRIIIDADEGVEIGEVIGEIDYSFESNTDGAIVIDTEIIDYEVKDSK